MTLLGGGFGRKSKCDFAIEAALISREIGAPVKLQWTRDDDIKHGFYHTTSVEHLEAAVDKAGKITGWRHRSVSPTIFSTFMDDPGYTSELEAGMGLVDNPFAVPNLAIEAGKAMAHTRIGWFRSVSNVPRAFAIQSFVAEIAAALGRDPKEMLLELIGPARVIDPVAAGMPEKLWNYGEPYARIPERYRSTAQRRRAGRQQGGLGENSCQRAKDWGLLRIAASSPTSPRSCASGSRPDGAIQVPEVHTAVDCGFCINPERVRSQMEGAATMGMTIALYSSIDFEKGAVRQTNYADYPIARITSYPENVHTDIVEHPFSVHATGVGEPGVPPFAPALANAIFAATGKRLRDLPFGDKVV